MNLHGGSCSPARPRFYLTVNLICSMPLLNQKLGGFASYYFVVWGVAGGGGPRRKFFIIFTTPRLDSPIGNFAAPYRTCSKPIKKKKKVGREKGEISFDNPVTAFEDE